MGLLNWLRRNQIVSGVVIAKKSYGGSAMPKEMILTKTNAIFYEGPQELIHPPPDTGAFILRVSGVDKNGNSRVGDIYVDELTFNCTDLGSEWKRS